MKQTLFAILAALGFSWPVLARSAGDTSPFLITMLIGAGTLGYTLAMWFVGWQSTGDVNWRAAAILLVAGVINGFGMQYYSKIITVPSAVAITLVLTPICVVLGMKLVYGDTLNSYKAAGLCLGCLAIYLLNIKS